MTDAVRYRLDDLRRLASALGAAAGLTPSRAAAFASLLAWYDESGFPSFGVGSLPDWLDRIADGRVDPSAEGTVAGETLGTVVFDGKGGLAPLILARAGELAIQKSRDAGVGLVRVVGIDGACPAAAVVAAMAAGPVAGALLGPGGSLALALPTDAGPALFDSSLGNPDGAGPLPAAPGTWGPWLLAMVPAGGYLVAAVSVPALEPVTTLHERVSSTLGVLDGAPGRVIPSTSEARRREAREHGVAVTSETWTRLGQWAERFGLALPPPASTATAIAHAPGGAR